MKKYHKIPTIFKRDPETRHKTLLVGEFSEPELSYLQNNEWEFTEKVDGTNIRVMWDGANIRFGGKTDSAQIPSPLMNTLNDMFLPKQELFKSTFGQSDVCFYGEGYGAKIQKGGGNYRQDQGFVLFDVRIDDWWLKRPDVEGIAEKFSLDIVPVVAFGTLWDMYDMVEKGFNSNWGGFRAEGIVARPLIELQSRNGSRIITKLKCKDFG